LKRLKESIAEREFGRFFVVYVQAHLLNKLYHDFYDFYGIFTYFAEPHE